MNEKNDTAQALLDAATELFVYQGYDATSVRAITQKANANLGAITYHFGSKDALVEAVVASVAEPVIELFTEVASAESSPLDRIENLVRQIFSHFRENPHLPRLLSQHFAGSRPLPETGRSAMRTNISTLATLIREGQLDGTIRSGPPHLLAISVGSQPMWMTLAQQALLEGTGLDQSDSESFEQVVESVVQFVRSGLQKLPESQE